jgi:membrane protein implicated in regulation of membrane protease activity
MVVFWGVSIVVFLFIEGVTAGLASIWFAIGAAAALISALFGAPLWLQIVWFVIISGITLVFTRPLAKKYVNSKRQPTNADRIIGMIGKVVETIDNISGEGQVAIGGKQWTARSVTAKTLRPEVLSKQFLSKA